MRKRNLYRSGRAQCCRNPGHDLDFNSSLPQGFHLFSAAAKDERISAFKPDYAKSEQRVLH